MAKETVKETRLSTCLRCVSLLEEIRIQREVNGILQDTIDDLTERIHQMEWAMGI